MSDMEPSTWAGIAVAGTAAAVTAGIDVMRRAARTWLRIKEKQAGLEPSDDA